MYNYKVLHDIQKAMPFNLLIPTALLEILMVQIQLYKVEIKYAKQNVLHTHRSYI